MITVDAGSLSTAGSVISFITYAPPLNDSLALLIHTTPAVTQATLRPSDLLTVLPPGRTGYEESGISGIDAEATFAPSSSFLGAAVSVAVKVGYAKPDISFQFTSAIAQLGAIQVKIAQQFQTELAQGVRDQSLIDDANFAVAIANNYNKLIAGTANGTDGLYGSNNAYNGVASFSGSASQFHSSILSILATLNDIAFRWDADEYFINGQQVSIFDLWNGFNWAVDPTNPIGYVTLAGFQKVYTNNAQTVTAYQVDLYLSSLSAAGSSIPTGVIAVNGQLVPVYNLLGQLNFGQNAPGGYQLYQSSGATTGHFIVNGVSKAPNQYINLTSAQLASASFQSGAGTATLWIRASDGINWSAWKSDTVTVPLPTLMVTSNPSAMPLSTLVTISDPAGVGYQKLELWDSNGTAAGGQLVVNGLAQTGGHEIDVAPASVANAVFDAGTVPGTDALWARLLQSDGTVSAWQPFTVTVPFPTLTVASNPSASRGQQLPLSTLVTISDPAGIGYSQLQLWDFNGTAAGGQFVINGAAQTGGHEIDVAPANVAGTMFDAGTTVGSDTLYAQLLQSNGQLTGWQKFTVTVPAPSLAVSTLSNATRGQQIALSTLITISDPAGVGYTQLELWDSNGTAAGGQFVVNAVAQTGGHEIDVASANVAGTVFDVGTLGGTDTLWAQLLESNGQTTGWQQFSVTAPAVRLPTLTVSNDSNATRGQTVALSTLVTISDPDSVGYQNTVGQQRHGCGRTVHGERRAADRWA
jgi:hypothetical protein